MNKKFVIILIILGLLLTACGAKTSPATLTTQAAATDNSTTAATAAPQNDNSANNASAKDLGSSLNLVLGGTDAPSVFDSYHIELTLDTPKANDDESAVVNEKLSISADVAGKNIHIFQTDPGATTQKEGYIIGDNDTEYKLVDGTWTQTMGQIALGWAMWPLQVVVPFATITSLSAHKTGSADVNGRTADVYELDSSKADPATLAGMKAVGVDITGKGQVWIDQKTGGMLKLDLTYTNNIMKTDGKTSIGSGDGHITIEISKVGAVTVTSPK
jgi:hypothetical protein